MDNYGIQISSHEATERAMNGDSAYQVFNQTGMSYGYYPSLAYAQAVAERINGIVIDVATGGYVRD